MARRRACWTLLLVVSAGLIAWGVTSLLVGSKLEIGPETTYVTGPLTADGRIDYAAALHERLSAGVKVEDNAAILIDKAFGPSAISPELRAQYFAWVGVAALPNQGDYVVTQSEFCKRKIKGAETPGELNEAIQKELSRSQSQPWTRAEAPFAAEWLDANTRPLNLIEEAVQRSQFYSPLVTSGGLLEAESTTQNLREAARLLVSRAMFRLGENDTAGAWSDLQTCHRLASLVGQRPPRILNYFVAIAIDAIAAHGDAVLMSQDMSPEQARTCLADHLKLAPLMPIQDVIGQNERLMALDSAFQHFRAIGLDLNVLLRRTNQSYDELVSALNHPSHLERNQATTALETKLTQRAAAAQQPLRMVANLVTNPRRAITRSISDQLFALLMPSISQADISQSRTYVRRDLVRIGFALTSFHSERGVYPQTLDDLVPKYLDAVPPDRFTEKPLLYLPRENGFLVYSVGANGNDDGGQLRTDRKQDDVSLEVPPKLEE